MIVLGKPHMAFNKKHLQLLEEQELQTKRLRGNKRRRRQRRARDHATFIEIPEE